MFYETAQKIVINKGEYTRVNDSTLATIDYFSIYFEYATSTRNIVQKLTLDIEEFVLKELDDLEGHKTIPLSLLISLTLFIPIVAYITLQATTSMFK